MAFPFGNSDVLMVEQLFYLLLVRSAIVLIPAMLSTEDAAPRNGENKMSAQTFPTSNKDVFPRGELRLVAHSGCFSFLQMN